ncbi:MAG: PEP-CTERM sorting domain-containing protein [Candidatus Methylumidiphilus sp.]
MNTLNVTPPRDFREIPQLVRALLLIGLGLAAQSAQAISSGIWSGGSTEDSNWSTPGNWSGVPPASSPGTSLTFGVSTGLINKNDLTNLTPSSLTFSAGAGSFTLGGNAFTLGTGGIVNNSSNSQTINNNIALGVGQTWNTGSANVTVGGGVSGSSTLTKTGASQLILNGNNTYTGTTTISAGGLVVNGSTNASSAVTVNAGASLGGTGTIGGNTSIAGIHNPGNSPGIQTFTNDLTYTGGASVVNWELKANTTANAANPNALFDSIVVGGNLAFDGATSLNLSFTPTGSSVLWSDAFWNSSKSGVNGWLLYNVTGSLSNFSNLSLASFNWLDSGANAFATALPGASFSLYQNGNNIYLDYTAATSNSNVPEPSSFALFGLGAFMLHRRFGKAA